MAAAAVPSSSTRPLLEAFEDEWTRTGTISHALYARLYDALRERV